MTFDELYKKLISDGVDQTMPDYDPMHLDCLLHPDKYPPVLQTETCESCEYDKACQQSCIFDAIVQREDGSLSIDPERCTGCGICIDTCKDGKLTASRDILPAMEAVRKSGQLSYALIAPAFLGQFDESVTPGQLRSAFKALGFSGMVEVALFADILTLKEALHFDKNINHDHDFQLTSCCCPLWISMIRKNYHELMPHVPGSVSPMIACGRVIKKLHKNAVTVFIGPCIAKKSEAKEPDLKGAIDYVLTFQEVQDIFDASDIHPALLPASEKDHSSRAGRIYARAGGVSEAVEKTLEQLNPNRTIPFRTQRADGVSACKEMIDDLKNGKIRGNFLEGMGCTGGCVGGPKAIINRKRGQELIDKYGDQAICKTPLENLYVLELLKRLGFKTVEEFIDQSDILTRSFE